MTLKCYIEMLAFCIVAYDIMIIGCNINTFDNELKMFAKLTNCVFKGN